jgi:aryl-alcohol dehydrogenase-like predicted oxidoreductase
MKRRFGKSNLEVGAMGLGCYAIGGEFRIEDGRPWGWAKVDDQESIKAIHAGLDMGINLLDTAQAYGCGHSEQVIGQAIKGHRDKVILATKFGKKMDEEKKVVLGSCIEPDHIRHSCEDSLRRFNTDYIDIFQWHESQGSVEDLPDVLEVLEGLVEAGKIRWYGWSTDEPDRFEHMASKDHCIGVQNRVNVFEPPTKWVEMLKLCEEHDLISINRTPLVMGILTGKFTENSSFPEEDVRHSLGFNFREKRYAESLAALDAISEVLRSGGRTTAQGALAWIWAQSERMFPIPGFKTVSQVVENANAMSFGPLNNEQVKQISEILEAWE